MTKIIDTPETATPETASGVITFEGKKYAPFKHSFRDPWADDDVELNFRFAKPTEPQIKRLQNTAGRDPSNAARNLLISTILPADKDSLVQALTEYPGIATSYSSALIKSVGISADLGN